jgi:uncharacterized protein YjbI with pentapeptide repeats
MAPTPRAPLDVRAQFSKPEYRKPDSVLQSVLDAHALWVETDGREGVQLTDEAAGFQFKNLMLDGVCLRRSKLRAVDFVLCSMVSADLSEALLEGSLFKDTDLTLASFRGANLRSATISKNSKIKGIDLFHAEVNGAKIPGVKPRSSFVEGFVGLGIDRL